jgi:hypothetical protein
MTDQTEAQVDGAPVFPITTTISGIAVVTIPVTDYAALLNCCRKLSESAARHAALNAVSKSPIERDLELASFLASRLGLATIAVIHDECLHRFGTARTPSKSSIFRYWSRLRGRPPR